MGKVLNAAPSGRFTERPDERNDMSGALILTARFDEAAQNFFQRQRDAHFPADLNIVPAHLTLFHKLPGEEHDAISRTIRDAVAERGPLPARVADVRFFGRGGGYKIECEGLVELRAKLAAAFRDWLTRQDQQKHLPHVTYQNKVPKEDAERTYARVLEGFAPFDAQVVALDLWWYRRHWDAAGTFPLAG